MKKKLTLVSLKCLETEDWFTDECRLEITVDGVKQTPLARDMSEDDVWDFGGPKEFIYQNEVKVQLLDDDDPNADDDLGTATVTIGDIGHGVADFTGDDAHYQLTLNVAVVLEDPGPAPAPKADFLKDKDGCRWILSLDGGGLRGLIPLLCLRELERYYGKPCVEMFDMFAGTSTGSIIASMLATGHSVDELVKMYDSIDTRRAIFLSNKLGQQAVMRHKKLPGSDTTVNDILNTVASAVAGIRTVAVLLTALSAGQIALAALSMICTLGAATPLVLVVTGAFAAVALAVDAAAIFMPDIRAMLSDMAFNGVAPLAITPKYQKGIKPKLAEFFRNGKADDAPQKKLKDCGFLKADGTFVPRDIFITAKDMFRSETVYLTAFHNPADPNDVRGTYREMKVKDAVEASASAPIYFNPRERFVDGGVGSYNNPAFVAAVEALRYSAIDGLHPNPPDAPFYKPYRETPDAAGNVRREGTVVWSFGTSTATLQFTADALARQDVVDFWINYVVDKGFQDANDQQNFLCREFLRDVKFKRFDVCLNVDSLKRIGITNRSDERLKGMIADAKLDAVEEAEFNSIREIAAAFSGFLADNGSFAKDGGEEIGKGFGTPVLTYARSVLGELETHP